eukprot:6904289-Prymnesium_polylepis.1
MEKRNLPRDPGKISPSLQATAAVGGGGIRHLDATTTSHNGRSKSRFNWVVKLVKRRGGRQRSGQMRPGRRKPQK